MAATRDAGGEARAVTVNIAEPAECEKLVRVALTPQADGLSIGQPETLFDVPPSPIESTFRDYDYDPVHDRFLFTRPPRGLAERREIAVSLGWAKRLADGGSAKR